MATSSKFADQIRDAVQDAVTSQDFSGLQTTIEQSIDVAARSIAGGIAQAQAAYKAAQQAGRAEQERRSIELRSQNLYGSTKGLTVAGVALVACGAFALVPAVPSIIFALASGGALAITFASVFTLAGAGLIAGGVRFLNLVRDFGAYKNYLGLREYCDVKDLARVTNDSPNKVVKKLKRMIDNHLFKQAAFDRGETTLILTESAYSQYEAAEAQYARRARERFMAESVTPRTDPVQPQTADAQALLARGEAYVAKIRLSNEAIQGEEISRKIDQIEHVVRVILQRAQEHPEVIDDLGQLMDYYLPTTVKLLDAYRDLDSQPIQGDNIIKSKREIEGALDSLAVAFEKLLDSVFRDYAWDVSADISVLHTVLAQEGLVEDPFDMGKKRQ